MGNMVDTVGDITSTPDDAVNTVGDIVGETVGDMLRNVLAD